MLTKSLLKETDETEVRFYLAEDFREEKDGKVTAISLFTDPNVWLNMPADHPNPTKRNPAGLHSLSFLFNVTKAPQGALVSIDLKGPDSTKSVFKDQPMPSHSPTTKSANFIVRMMPCVITSLGDRTFTVTVNKREFHFGFSIDRLDSHIAAIETTSPHKKSAPKKSKSQ